MRFGGIGATELIIVLVIVLIIFGVGRLPGGKGLVRGAVPGEDARLEGPPGRAV